MSAAAGCGGHAGDHAGDHAALADELRGYVSGALDLLEPWIEQVRDAEPAEGVTEPASCAVCPVCAVITVLRGGRSELAARMAEQATGLVAVLRAAIAEGVGGSSAGFSSGFAGGADSRSADSRCAEGGDDRRGVQRIQVSRGDGTAPSGPC